MNSWQDLLSQVRSGCKPGFCSCSGLHTCWKAARWLREGGDWGRKSVKSEGGWGWRRSRLGVARCLKHILWSSRTLHFCVFLPARVCYQNLFVREDYLLTFLSESEAQPRIRHSCNSCKHLPFLTFHLWITMREAHWTELKKSKQKYSAFAVLWVCLDNRLVECADSGSRRHTLRSRAHTHSEHTLITCAIRGRSNKVCSGLWTRFRAKDIPYKKLVLSALEHFADVETSTGEHLTDWNRKGSVCNNTVSDERSISYKWWFSVQTCTCAAVLAINLERACRGAVSIKRMIQKRVKQRISPWRKTRQCLKLKLSENRARFEKIKVALNKGFHWILRIKKIWSSQICYYHLVMNFSIWMYSISLFVRPLIHVNL